MHAAIGGQAEKAIQFAAVQGPPIATGVVSSRIKTIGV